MTEHRRLWLKNYRLVNREKIYKKLKEWKLKNPESYSSYSKKRKDYFSDRRQIVSIKYRDYQNSAKRKGIEFNLTLEEVTDITKNPCHYCLVNEKIGIDRKDNTIGYIKSNSLPCCWICNRMKGNQLYKNFLEKCTLIAKNLS